ncbi:MAG: xanthine dehydrogenase family protein molybdopterin-binding subunit [Deltaproteobacteria bacterium]|nr:xanthine dehydrogenase family protein molybdopterin-binding subunit [Deltaproteobacteria bacterium]
MAREKNFAVVGKPLPVKDAVEKVTGSLKYAVDLKVPDMVYGKILRSPHAHARIKRIDSSEAEALPGVLGVLTAADTPGRIWKGCWFNYRGKVLDEIARFVGDEVAAVAATSEAIAEAALDLIAIDYEVLPAVFEAERALASDAPQIREEGNARDPFVVEWGDLEKGQRDADFIIETEVDFGSQQMAPIGRNACIAEWHGDKVTVWTSTQTPSELQTGLSQALDIPQSRVRVISSPTGSSFGQWWSNNFMMVTALLAKKIRRPVRIELSNAECMSTVKRRHKEHTRGRIGATADGRITMIDIDHLMDNGAYGFKDDVGCFSPDNWGRTRSARYVVQGVSTNLVTAGCMRGVGDVTMSCAVERLCDMAAAKLGIDPIEFRLKNQIEEGEPLRIVENFLRASDTGREDCDGAESEPMFLGEIPENRPEPGRLSSGSNVEILGKGAEAFGWKEKWVGWGKPYLVDGPRHRAVGVGTGIHCCGAEDEGNSAAIVHINPDGSAKVHCAVGRQGQGSETTQTQVAAEALGIPYECVEIEAGDTDSCPWNHGSIASNTMYRTGFATWSAAMDARRQILEIAARDLFDTQPSELDIQNGIVVFKKSSTGRSQQATLEEVLNALRPDAMTPMSSITGRSAVMMPPPITHSRHFAAHFVDLEVDVETGEIRLLDYVATQDSGTVMNPQILKNQAIGGAICGVGFAIYESLSFDRETGQVRNGNLLDYKLLRAADFPARSRVLFAESYDPVGPFGARGAGEAPMAAAVPAVCQAVYNATGAWMDIPMTPERVLNAISQCGARPAM